MKKQVLYAILSGLTFLCSYSQEQVSHSASDILQGLYKLNKTGRVLYIAAHPDDENTRLLAYISGEKKLETAYLSITRGDGGQNLVGKEQGDALGLIRTQELLAARRVDGAEQFFTRANDFGYSKSPEETFRFWNKDSILSDVVLIIRRFRPDLIICRFPTTGEGGHGHHTASAILAMEAFDAAADSSRFPWQLKYYPVWKTRSILWNTFNFGSTNTTSPDQIKCDVGAFNAVTGKSYGEIAAQSRSMHKSQGFGSPAQRGSNIEYFKFLKGDSIRHDLFENLDKPFSDIFPVKELKESITGFDMAHPEKSVPALVSLYRQINANNSPAIAAVKEEKLAVLTKLITACAGLWLEASASEYIAVPGSSLQVNVQAIARNNYPVQLVAIHYPYSDTTVKMQMKPNNLVSFKRTIQVSGQTAFSNPYWLNKPHDAGRYQVNDPLLIGRPQNEAPLKVVFDVEIAGFEFNMKRDVVYKWTDPVKGEKYRPLEILPPATVEFGERALIFTNGKPRTVSIIIRSNTAMVNGYLAVSCMGGWRVDLHDSAFSLNDKGSEVILTAQVTPAANTTNGRLSAFLHIGNKTCQSSLQRIEYDHIPYQFILKDAATDLVYIDLKKRRGAIGFIPGAGDETENCLKQAGYEVTTLSDEQLRKGDLKNFTAIVTGVRAYNVNEKLQIYYDHLMDYVKNGGNLVVQYNTNSRVGPLQAKIGPWPFTISRDRVTDEKAEVTYLDERHAALNQPNKITAVDFDNWIQERGIYFATETDSRYEKLLRMNDPGEKALDGSLIIGKYGKGNFVYTGLAFFRQMPAGIPGAYRLFANLLALPKN